MQNHCFLFIAVVIGMIAISSCKHAPVRNAPETPEKPDIVIRNHEEARLYLREILDKPLPDDFEIPSYITAGYPLEQVYDTFRVIWPEFYGKEYEEYLDAIVAYPNKVEGMLNHSKAIRRTYQKDSRY